MQRQQALIIAIGILLGTAAWSQSPMLPNGVPTIHLDAPGGAAMPIAYDPTFDYYYGSHGGSPGNATYVWSSSGGAPLQATSIDIDMRAFLYNPNTNDLEACPYGVRRGAYPYASANRAGGMLSGGHAPLVAVMPGIPTDQCSPAYDAARDVLYARDSGSVVNISRRSDGVLTGTVTLDFGASGMGNDYTHQIGYDPDHDLLMVGDQGPSPNVVRAFDRATGGYVGSAVLTIDNPYPYYNGNYTNEQWFVWDGAGWQGYTITLPPGGVEVRTVDSAPASVRQGDMGLPVGVTIENVGVGSVDVTAVALSFTGSADRTSEYVVTPDPLNPIGIAGGATETFNFTVEVSVSATLELITIDASFSGSDPATMATYQDAGADITDTWQVLGCGTTVCGDCTGDGALTILDALMAAQHAAALVTLTGVDFTNCNVTGILEPDPAADITVLDALTLAQVAAGLPVTPMCC